MQGFTELQSDQFCCQELQQTQSMQCGINPRTHLRKLTIKGSTIIGTMPTAEFENGISCDLLRLGINSPFSANHRKIAAKLQPFSAEIISSLFSYSRSSQQSPQNQLLKKKNQMNYKSQKDESWTKTLVAANLDQSHSEQIE
jgi:hypothetical protein